ncbi:hypothetical protein EJB05_26219 [Eragrostis curvula]|uniref:tyrosine--tRNA ligase n=1 Tax=Eragrostis curvula TaxID=38414 RepID=A0A5J9UJY5_9POAL|nr:hypothetical protein EJB05_26219 [Eragrostis curvula]
MAATANTPEEKAEVLRGVAEDFVGDEDLQQLLRNKPNPVCFDGFEPSGTLNIAQGIGTVTRVNKMVRAGFRVKIVIADWFALLNKKMGGDFDTIRAAGHRMIETWKALGMAMDGVEFLWSSEEIQKRASEYWPLVLDIAQKSSVERIVSCSEIMGRSEKDDLSAGQFMYPLMQCADVFFFEVDICQMSMDQREVNMLARDYCEAIKRKTKPIILSHHTLPGLKEGQKNMSKSDESAAIFMEDNESQVKGKIKKAFCPPKTIEENPCLEYIKHIVFPWFGRFDVLRKEANGGDKIYNRMEEVFVDYASGALHPADVKSNLAKAINQILQVVRDHFKNNSNAKVPFNAVKPVPSSSSIEDLPSSMPPKIVEERLATLLSIGEECIEEDELKLLLRDKPNPICYDGFEPSGRMHIAQGVGKALNVNKMIKSGCRVKIWIADWFAMLNKKIGADLNKIQTVGRYMIEIWKALGMNTDGVEFLWASEEINKRINEYWSLVMDIAQKRSLNRIVRCCQIMGRSEKDALSAAQILYPLMQCADIFFLEVDICQMGMDQRKVNMLAREYCEVIRRKNRPIILSHHMLPGFKESQQKMSKSNPSSAIFMEDNESEVNLKIKEAFCPAKTVEGNPCLEYVKHIVFPWFGRFEVIREEDNGGNKNYNKVEELFEDYSSGALHPDDVKFALAKAINQILQPVRDHFNNNSDAKALFSTVKGYMATHSASVGSTLPEEPRS